MKLELEGKRVLVTGGSRGIGLACVEKYLEEGATVTIAATSQRSIDAAQEHCVQRELGMITGVAADLGTAKGIENLQEALLTTDIVVNNAGAIPGGGLETVDDASWRHAWELKLYGYLNVCRQVLPIMKNRGRGVVVNVIGIAGAAPRYDYICGAMANSALVSFTRAAGAESTRHGVRILGINPGPTQTERLISLAKARAAQRFGDEGRWQETLTHLPFGRPALPEEIADLVVFLSSTRASYLSGVVIDADGGGMYLNG